ncbi:hypothetical protein G9A89_020376 [Geosiphon pyriformis]|nr:hypothetical protein G9A89_020376 [Geosiphon pyriformis]
MVSDVPNVWHCQYQLLEYVFDEAFPGVICSITFDEMSDVISNLPDEKAAGLSGISNELWKHYNRSVLDMLLVLLNFCLNCESVSRPWKKAWMSMIPKPYEWEDVFMNTYPIALIKMAHKILSKILSDRIFVVCSRFNVLRGDNFSILKGTTTQSPIFAIELVVENALEKNYFGLTNEYQMHDGLDQGEMFSPLFWYIFYDPLLCKAESKSASVISFANSVGILGHLFAHKSHDLQVLSWHSHHLLFYSSCININPLDNFLAGIVQIFLECDLFLDGLMTNAFYFQNGTPMSDVLEVGLSSVLESCEFEVVCSHLLEVDFDRFFLFMDGFLNELGTLGMKAGAVVFFENINLSLGVRVSELVSSTMVELQAIALALECVLSSYSINLFSDSQAALDACKSESRLICSDFRNQCWIKHHHIANVIHQKNLDINWVKVKDYSGVLDNEQVDAFTGATVLSNLHLSHMINEHFLRAGGTAVSDSLHTDVDWFRSSLVWHLDLYLAAGFTNTHTAGLWMYFMKALHYHLLVAVHHVFSCPFDAVGHVRLVEVHAFSDIILHNDSVSVLVSGLPLVFLASVVRLLGIVDVFGMGFGFCKSCLFFTGISDVVSAVGLDYLYMYLSKDFMLKDWIAKAKDLLGNDSKSESLVVDLVCHFAESYRSSVWLPRAKLRAHYKKHGLLPCDGSIVSLVTGLSLVWSCGMIHNFGIRLDIHACFSFHP